MLNTIYENSPHPLQALLLNLYALGLNIQRYGKPFHRQLEALLESQWFTENQIDEYQAHAINKMVTHAYNTVPYYKKVMNERGLYPSDFTSKKDLEKLPILEKDDIRKNFKDLISRSVYGKNLGFGRTSGTTGSPLLLAWDRNLQIFNNAVDWRQKCWAGVEYGEKVALLLGRPIVQITRKQPPFWQYNFIHKQLWMSAFHMKPSNLNFYLKKLKEFKPAAIEGYPSTLFSLAKFANLQGEHIEFKAAFSSSETLHSFQRDEIEHAFKCKVYDFYGSAERVLFATQCTAHQGQHVNFEYGYLELLNKQDQPIEINNSPGVMVATSLQNFGMPLIRYRLGDKTSFLEGQCTCGRKMKRMECVQTKAEDNIIRPDGTVISPSILTHPFKPIENIVKSQIIQHTATDIEIIIVKRPKFSAADEHQLLAEFRKRVGAEFDIKLSYKEEIPLDANAKFRWVINNSNKSRKIDA